MAPWPFPSKSLYLQRQHDNINIRRQGLELCVSHDNWYIPLRGFLTCANCRGFSGLLFPMSLSVAGSIPHESPLDLSGIPASLWVSLLVWSIFGLFAAFFLMVGGVLPMSFTSRLACRTGWCITRRLGIGDITPTPFTSDSRVDSSTRKSLHSVTCG